MQSIDLESKRHRLTWLPHLSDNQHAVLSASGHYRGSGKNDEHLVYVALLDDGSQVTYTPAEYGQVRLEERSPASKALCWSISHVCEELKRISSDSDPQPRK